MMNGRRPPADEREGGRAHGWSQWSFSRRGFILSLVGGGLVAATAARLERRLLGLVRSRLGAATGRAETRAARLGAAELGTLTALGRVLLPSSFCARAPTADAVIAGIIQDLADTGPPVLAELRAAGRLLDAESAAAHGARFTGLDERGRSGVVERLLRPYTTRRLLSSPYYYLTARGQGVRRLWHEVAQPIIVGFYNTSHGWRVVGYSRRPGECSDLIDYQSPLA